MREWGLMATEAFKNRNKNGAYEERTGPIKKKDVNK